MHTGPEDRYRRLSDYNSQLNRIQFRVELLPKKKKDKVTVLTPEKRELIKKVEKETFKRLEDNWGLYDTEEVKCFIEIFYLIPSDSFRVLVKLVMQVNIKNLSSSMQFQFYSVQASLFTVYLISFQIQFPNVCK